MTARRDASDQIDFALRRHFSAVFTPEEREALVEVIRAWDCAHPDLGPDERRQAWLAIARESRQAAAPLVLAAL